MCVEFVIFVRNLGALVRATVGGHSVDRPQVRPFIVTTFPGDETADDAGKEARRTRPLVCVRFCPALTGVLFFFKRGVPTRLTKRSVVERSESVSPRCVWLRECSV